MELPIKFSLQEMFNQKNKGISISYYYYFNIKKIKNGYLFELNSNVKNLKLAYNETNFNNILTDLPFFYNNITTYNITFELTDNNALYIKEIANNETNEYIYIGTVDEILNTLDEKFQIFIK